MRELLCRDEHAFRPTNNQHHCYHDHLTIYLSIDPSIYLSIHAYIGEQQKRRASTAMNDRSSRAHSLFIVTLKQTHLDRNVTINSRLFMADLGVYVGARTSTCCLCIVLHSITDDTRY
jgi:hypothetical protein